MSVRLFIGNLPYTASEAELRQHLSSVGEPASVVLPVDRETGRPRGFAFVDYADRAVAEAAIKQFDQQPFKGRPLAVSEARPREDRGPGGPRPGGFGGPPRPSGWAPPRPGGPAGPGGGFGGPRPGGFNGPRPGGFGPRPSEGGAPGGPRSRNFGPDAPPKHKRKQKENRERGGPRGPIKERPVGRLYDADEDWRSLGAEPDEPLDIDDIATHKEGEEAVKDDDLKDDADGADEE